MRLLHRIFQTALYCLALIELLSPPAAIAQQASLSDMNGVIDCAPKAKVFGGQFAFQALLPVANSSFTLGEVRPPATNDYADTWMRSLNLAWDWNRANSWVAYSFTTPAGRYDPGGSWTAVPGRSTVSPLLAAMTSVTGAVTRFMHMWPYKSFDERARLREKAIADGLWPPPGGPGHLLSQQVDIYLPAAFSPMK